MLARMMPLLAFRKKYFPEGRRPSTRLVNAWVDRGLLKGTRANGRLYVDEIFYCETTRTGSQSYDVIVQLRNLFRTSRKNAAVRGHAWSLHQEDIRRIYEKQGGRCAVTCLRFSWERVGVAVRRPWVPSIDRIDCAQGYTTENVRLVCCAVNLALNEWGESVFAMIARAYVSQAGPE